MPGPLTLRYSGVQFKAPSVDGTAGQAMVTNGSKQLSFAGPFLPLSTVTAVGDLIVGAGAGSVSRLAKGSSGTLLGINSSGDLAYSRVITGAGESEAFAYRRSDDATKELRLSYRIGSGAELGPVFEASTGIFLFQRAASNSAAICIGKYGTAQSALLESTATSGMGNNVLQLYGGLIVNGAIELGGAGDTAIRRDGAGRMGIVDYGGNGSRSYRDLICRDLFLTGSPSGDPAVANKVYADENGFLKLSTG